MTLLLPQPGGFEGALVAETLEADDFPVTQLSDPRRRFVDGNTTFAAASEGAPQYEDTAPRSRNSSGSMRNSAQAASMSAQKSLLPLNPR